MQTKDQTPFSPSPTDFSPQRRWEDVVNLLMRGKWVIITSLLVMLTIAALYTFLSDPVYEATSTVLVETRAKDTGLPFLDLSGTAAATKITNELETLKGRSTAEAVARALLDKTYLDEAGKRFIPIIRAETDGGFADVKEDPVTVSWRLQDAVHFTPIKESDIIWITARSNDPDEAALLANTYTSVYAERNTSASRVKSRALREFLEGQMQAKHASLDSTEHAVQSFMKNSGVVSLDAEASRVVDQLSQLEATRDALDLDISTRTKSLNSYKQELAVQEPNVEKAIGESNDTYLRLLQEQLARLEVQRDVVIAQNPELADQKIYSEKLKEIDTQIESLKNNLKTRTKTFLASLIPGERTRGGQGGETAVFLSEVKQKIIEQQIELDAMIARKAALNNVIVEYERQFNGIPAKSIGLAKLQRARLSNEKLYLLVEEKYNEAAITEKSEFGYVNILDTAATPGWPVSPKPSLNLALGVILGLFVGTGIVVVRSRMDDRIQGPEDLKKHGIIPLATIGKIELEKQKNGHTSVPGKNGSSSGENGSSPPGRNGSGVDQHLVAYLSPLSPLSEAYRHLRTNVLYNQPDRPVRTIMVTSPSPKEGKSTTVCNLAISFAQGENRVLLVDGDLRCPMVHTLFGLNKQPGLTEALFGQKTFEECVHKNVMENLDVLCCGTSPSNPAEVFNSRKMREFVLHAQTLYDIVLFDAPPVLAVTDAAILSRLVDAVLVVVRAEHTGLASVDRVGEIFQGVGRQPAGIILNNLDVQKAYGINYGRHRRDHYSYGYGYTANGGSSKK